MRPGPTGRRPTGDRAAGQRRAQGPALKNAVPALGRSGTRYPAWSMAIGALCGLASTVLLDLAGTSPDAR